MGRYRRLLDLELPPRQSAFLWGPRKTGKSTLLADRFPESARFDLLDTRQLLAFTREPWLFGEQVTALDAERRERPILVDEVQRVPALLDEVHRLIESHGLSFVLCGSSARKLRRGGANLLGGRAWRFALHPLAWPEVPDFDLLRALDRGLVPQHYDASAAQARAGGLRGRLPEGGGLQRRVDPQRGRVRAVLRRARLLPRAGVELQQRGARLRRRCEDGARVLPDPGRHAARRVRRAVQPPEIARGDRPRAAGSTSSTWASPAT